MQYPCVYPCVLDARSSNLVLCIITGICLGGIRSIKILTIRIDIISTIADIIGRAILAATMIPSIIIITTI